MPKFRKMTKTTASRVLRRMADMSDRDPDFAQMFAEAIDPILTDLECEDAFGTEGQLDPRGDHRD